MMFCLLLASGCSPSGNAGNSDAGIGDGIDASADGGAPLPPAIGFSLGTSGSVICLLLADHTIACQGRTSTGVLGNGQREDFQPLPKRVLTVGQDGGPPVPLEHVTKVALGFFDGCALLEDTTVHCWGDGTALGDDFPTYRSVAAGPVHIEGPNVTMGPPMTGVVDLAGHPDSSTFCALMMDGTARCWGGNPSGQAGTGRTGQQQHYAAPVIAAANSYAPLSGIRKVYMTSSSTGCATIVLNQGVDCWGLVPTPVMVSQGLLANVADVSGWCGLHVDGTVDCWGSCDAPTPSSPPCNTAGPLLTAAAGPRVTGALQIAAPCIRFAGGAVQCWADYPGDGTMLQQPYPVSVLDGPDGGPIAGAVDIQSGSDRRCMMRADGSLLCWGKRPVAGAPDVVDLTPTPPW